MPPARPSRGRRRRRAEPCPRGCAAVPAPPRCGALPLARRAPPAEAVPRLARSLPRPAEGSRPRAHPQSFSHGSFLNCAGRGRARRAHARPPRPALPGHPRAPPPGSRPVLAPAPRGARPPGAAGAGPAPGTAPAAARPGPARPGPVRSRTARYRTVPLAMARYCSVPYSSVRPGTARHGTAQPGTVQPGTVQPGTAQPIPVRYGTGRYGTVQPGTARPGACGERCRGRGARSSAHPTPPPFHAPGSAGSEAGGCTSHTHPPRRFPRKNK